MRIREVMTAQVRTVAPTMPAAEAWELMRTTGVRHLVVKSEQGVVGLLSDVDAGGPNGAMVRAHSIVSDLMNRRVESISPDDTVRKAANLMRGRAVGCLAVIERGVLRGIVTTSDLLAVLGRGIDRPGRESRPALSHRVPHRKGTGAGRW